MRKRRTQTYTLPISTHVLAWVFVLALPFLMFWKNENVDFLRILRNHGTTTIACALVFYLEYFFLTERYLFRKKTLKFIGLSILLIGFASLFTYLLKDFNVVETASKHGIPPPNSPAHRILFYFREVFSMTVVAGVSIMIKVMTKWYDTESQRQEEEKRRKEAELLNLRQQINPHFFFNTLNNIYALIDVSPEKAQSTILELSKLMRYILYENNNNFVPVNKELDFIRNYIELMRIRLTDNVDVRVDIQVSQLSDKLIAPMLFISLIENAFKHGVSHTQPSFIHIDIHETDKHQLVCLVSNSFFPKNENDKSGSGIGLENLYRRLDILYPHQYSLRKEENNMYTIELIVPLS